MDGDDVARAARRIRRRIHKALDEAAFRPRTVKGATYYRSLRLPSEDVSFVARRFPRRGEPDGDPGPDFVLVHGIGVSSRSYGPTAAELARHGTVHLIDLPGYGASPRPGHDVSIAEHAAAVAWYLRETGLQQPVVVGHSMGTQVVAQLAADEPELVGRIVLIAPVIWPDARSFWRAVRLLAVDGLREPPIVTLLALNDYLFRAGIPYMIEQTPHLIGNRMEEIVDGVTMPTLVIGGDADPIVPLDWAQQIADAVEDGRFEAVTGPHVAMFSDAAHVARLIADFARE
jgi:pimeloyl-ACP methyl ester carboxylesterase